MAKFNAYTLIDFSQDAKDGIATQKCLDGKTVMVCEHGETFMIRENDDADYRYVTFAELNKVVLSDLDAA